MEEIKLCEVCGKLLPIHYDWDICKSCLEGAETSSDNIIESEEFLDLEEWDENIKLDEDLTFLRDQDPGDEH